jgi:hypothetical protein
MAAGLEARARPALETAEDQCVSYHCTVAILRNGGSARSPCAAAVPGISAAIMLRAKMNDSTESLSIVFGVNRFECIDLQHSPRAYGTRDDLRHTRLNQLNCVLVNR